MKTKQIRILVADDHKLMRMGLKSLMVGNGDLVCVGEAENGEMAVDLARRLRPDVILMDLMMPVLSGGGATRIIHREMPEIRIIILTSYGTSKEMADAISAGASGALTKDVDTTELADTIRKVAAGGTCISRKLKAMSREEEMTPDLTEHQTMILSSIVAGHSNEEIATEFGITRNTVKHIITTIFNKLGVSSRAELMALTIRKHLIGQP